MEDASCKSRADPKPSDNVGDSKSKTKKEPKKCLRCRNHGVISVLKGHKDRCQFRFCTCPLCNLLAQRQQIARETVAVRRRLDKAESMGYKFQEESSTTPSVDEKTKDMYSLTRTVNWEPGITDVNRHLYGSVTLGWQQNFNARFPYQPIQPNVYRHYTGIPDHQVQYSPMSFPQRYPVLNRLPYVPASASVPQLSPRDMVQTSFYSNDFSLAHAQGYSYEANNTGHPATETKPQFSTTGSLDTKGSTFLVSTGNGSPVTSTVGISPCFFPSTTCCDTNNKESPVKEPCFTELRPVSSRSCMYQPSSPLPHPVPEKHASHSVVGMSLSHPVPTMSLSYPVSGNPESHTVTGGSLSQPMSGSSPSQPMSGSSFSQPTSGSSPSQPMSGSSFSQPMSGSSFSQPTPGGSPSQPMSGSSFSQPMSGSSLSQPMPGSIPTQPIPASSPSQPMSGSSLSQPPRMADAPQGKNKRTPDNITSVSGVKRLREDPSESSDDDVLTIDLNCPSPSDIPRNDTPEYIL